MCRAFLDAGLEVRALVRAGSDRSRLPVARLSFAEGDIVRPETLRPAFEGCDVVVNLVGIIREKGLATFQRVHAEGTANVVREAASAGVKRIVQMSAVGARPDAPSAYHRTKSAGEESVRASGVEWVILRPSLIFGPGDGFTTTMIDLVRRAPVIPIIGSGDSRMQPIAVQDVCAAFVASARSDGHAGKTYELGGPEVLTYRAIVRQVADEMGVRKAMVHLPVALIGAVAQVMSRVTSAFPLTPDQLLMLQEDNIAQPNHAAEVFGLHLTAFEAALGAIIAAQRDGTAA